MASNLQSIVPFSTVNDTPDDYCFYRRYEEAEPCERPATLTMMALAMPNSSLILCVAL